MDESMYKTVKWGKSESRLSEYHFDALKCGSDVYLSD